MPRRPASPRLLGVGAVVVVLLLAAAAVAVLAIRQSSSANAGSNSVHSHPAGTALAAQSATAAKYGGIPKWLPKAKVPVNRVVTATTTKPALAIQGDAVWVHLNHGRVLATAVGPRVPEEGEFPVPATSPCTFVVTFASASGVVPIRPSAFTVVDDLGHLHHPEVTALDGGPPPRRVPSGRSLSLRVHEVLPTGNGGLSWAPHGGRPIATWDFDVEID
jgi:hypothetical protein